MKKQFCKRGVFLKNYNWEPLFFKLKSFYLEFKFKFILNSNKIEAEFLPKTNRFKNNIRFFKQYVYIIRKFKWMQMNIKTIFSFMEKARKAILEKVIKQQKEL